MKTNAGIGSQPAGRWDGRRVLFEIEHDGKLASCAVTADALRALTLRRCFKPRDVLASFAAARLQVEEIARAKLRARVAPNPTPLTVWQDDAEDYVSTSGPSGDVRQ